MTQTSLRPLTAGDGTLLARATLGNLNWSAPRFTERDVAGRPEFRHYTEMVPERGDVGFVAERGGEAVGVTWAQLLPADDPGYGFIDESTPEVSVWVREDARGRGVGRTLLRRLQQEAVRRGIARLSLSVEAGNPAARLYASLGFTPVTGRETDGVMVWPAGREALVTVGDAELEVEVTGTGEPVVVIQTALDADELRPLSRQLAQSGDYQVIHYHRRGYGGSGPVRRPRSIADEAADTAALIHALAATPAHVVGASFSAAIGLALAVRNPEVVHTLAAVETPPAGTAGSAEFRELNRQLLRSHHDRGAPAALESFMTMLVGPDWREVSEEGSPGSVRVMERGADTFFTSDVPALASWEFDATDAQAVRAPVLCVGGAVSTDWFTEMHARLLRELPHSDGVTVDGAGHLVASTHPGEVAALLRAHFARHPRPDG